MRFVARPKTFCLLLSLCMSTTLIAQPIIMKPWSFSANVGNFQAAMDTTYNDQTDLIPQNVNQTLFQHGYTVGLAVGYSQLFCNQYLLGAEFLGNYNSGKARFASGASTLAFTDREFLSYNIDLLFVPGIVLSESSALYGKIGFSFSQLESDISSPSGFTPTNSTVNSTKNLFGLAVGIGLKKWINNSWAIFTEYNYHDFGTVNFANFQNFTATYTHTTHVYTQSIAVGVSYMI